MRNILIIYWYKADYPPRTTIADHLNCFRKYSGCRCFYVNLAFGQIPTFLTSLPFDLIILHTLFFEARGHRSEFAKVLERARPLTRMSAPKIGMPQDEFLLSDDICRVIKELGLGHVLTVAPESEWAKIYRGIDFGSVHFHQILTGYLDTDTLSRIEVMRTTSGGRPIDVGYRARKGRPEYGRHAQLKWQIAELFSAEAEKHGLSTDISTDPADTRLGDAWYQFLLKCRYTIGVEGGASVLDRDGSIADKTGAYLSEHPGASLDDIGAACFPEEDGRLQLAAISPRQLEACATMTCQVLVEGAYNGILVPGRHYIELKKDFSNLEQVMQQMQDEELRMVLVTNAFADVIESGEYTYQKFVRHVLDYAEVSPALCTPGRVAFCRLAVRLQECLAWCCVWFHARITRHLRSLMRQFRDCLIDRQRAR